MADAMVVWMDHLLAGLLVLRKVEMLDTMMEMLRDVEWVAWMVVLMVA